MQKQNKKEVLTDSNTWSDARYKAFGRVQLRALDLLDSRGGTEKVVKILSDKLIDAPAGAKKANFKFNLSEIKKLTTSRMNSLADKCKAAMPKK